MASGGRGGFGRYTVADLKRICGEAATVGGDGEAMAAKKQAGGRPKWKVEKAALAGVNWPDRKVSGSVYMMDGEFCHDLSYWMNRAVASVICEAAPNGHGWTHLVSWPGRGVFATIAKKE